MAQKKVTRKVISRPSLKQEEPKYEEKSHLVATDVGSARDREESRDKPKRFCSFCKNKSIPSYTDLANLRRFLTDRAKILGKERSGVCSKHQRAVSKNIKYARHLALLPFVPKI